MKLHMKDNTITMKEGKMCHWTSQEPPHHVASMLKEKAAFLPKHDQALFGKDFRDHLTESLKAKRHSIKAIAEISKSTNRKRSFREGPSFYQGWPNGRQKFRSNYNGKYILFQKKSLCFFIKLELLCTRFASLSNSKICSTYAIISSGWSRTPIKFLQCSPSFNLGNSISRTQTDTKLLYKYEHFLYLKTGNLIMNWISLSLLQTYCT